MSDNKYTVTFKAAQMGADYLDKGKIEDSSAGHMWYVLQRNDEKPESFGFEPIDKRELDIYFRGLGHITAQDEGKYLEYEPPITIQLTQQQYEILKDFGTKEGALRLGFNPYLYDGLNNNCVQYVFKALHLIGYNPNNELHQKSFPRGAFLNLVFNLIQYSAIRVTKNELKPVGYGSIFDKDNEIIGYDNYDDHILGGDGNDCLISKSGDDILDGGKRNDVLDGGDGFDVYYAGKGDTIIDSDGQGKVLLNNKVLRGGERNSKKDPEGGLSKR